MRLTRFLTAYLNAHLQGWFSPKRQVFGLGELVKFRPEITYNNDRKDRSGKKLPDGIEVRFGENVPSREVRERLKAAGFQFSDKQPRWYAYDTASNVFLAKAFIETFATDEVEVIPFKEGYEAAKNWFLAKVRNEGEWKTIPSMAPIKAEGGTYKNKESFLASGQSWVSLMNQGKLYFKKFFQKKDAASTTTPATPNPSVPSIAPSTKPSAGDPDRETSEKLRNLGLGMEKTIQLKLNPPIAQQRKTHRRVSISRGMRQEGLELLKVQQSLYALADAYLYGSPISPMLRKFRTKLDVEALVTGYDAVINNPKHNWSVPKRLVPLGVKTMEDWRKTYDELAALVNLNKQHQPQILTEIQKLQAEVDALTDELAF